MTTPAAATEEPPFDEADPIAWLLANAPAEQPTKPPEPRLNAEETADFFVSHINALAWAAKSEHTRLSALYTIARTYGYPFIADRIIDLTVGVKSEAVKLSALNVIGRSLGALQPPSSLEPPKPEPTEPGYDLIRLFESDLNELQELTTCPLPGRPGPPVDVDAYLETLDQAYSPHTFQLPTPEELAADLAAEYKKIAEAPPPKPPDNLETASALEVGAYLVARFPDNPGARSFAERHGLPVPPAPPSLRNPDDGRPSHIDAPDGPQVFSTTWSQAEHEAFINDFANFPPPLPADQPHTAAGHSDDSASNPATQPPKPPATESERTPLEQMLAEYAAQVRSEHNQAALRAEAAGLPPPRLNNPFRPPPAAAPQPRTPAQPPAANAPATGRALTPSEQMLVEYAERIRSGRARPAPRTDPFAPVRGGSANPTGFPSPYEDPFAPPRSGSANVGGFPSPYDDPFAPPYDDPFPPRRKLTRRERELAALAEADAIGGRFNPVDLRAFAAALPRRPASQWRHPYAPPEPAPQSAEAQFRLLARQLSKSQDVQPGAPAAPKPPSAPSRNPVPNPRTPSPRLPTPRLPRTLHPPNLQPPAPQEPPSVPQEPPPTAEQATPPAECDPQPPPAPPGEPPTPKQKPQHPPTTPTEPIDRQPPRPPRPPP